jgi:serine/threonine-protein kinase
VPAGGSTSVCPVCGAETLITQPDTSLGDEETLDPAFVPRLIADVETLIHASSPPASADPDDRPKVEGYEVLGILGRGGMGVVYKAQHLRLNRLVALKMVLAGAHAGPQERVRFRLEAEALASLQHPNIVQVYEVGEHERNPYLALEFIDGPSLDQKTAGKPQAPRQAAQLVQSLARAMYCAHQRGVIHRDLKPANVLLTADGVPKLTDFGLAKRLGEEDSGTRTGTVMGTPSYMAPEQAAGKTRELGPATDIYGLGAILYHLLTGRPPFAAATALETIQQVQDQEPVAPTRLQPKLPADLETICLKCLQKQPLKRYASALDVAEDLRRFLGDEPIAARPVSRRERLWKWAKRRPAAAALIVVTTVAAATVGCGLVWHTVRLGAERDYAERNFRRALSAVDQMLTEVAEEQLAWEPRMEEKRRALLQQALRFYQEFLNEKSTDPALRKETGLAYKRMGDVSRLLEQYDQALNAYGEATALLGQLADDFPARPEYRQELATCHNFQGEVLRQASRPREAGAAYKQALRLQEQLAAEYPAELAYQQDLARTYYNQGILFKEDNHAGEAEAAFLRAIETLQQLVKDNPAEPKYQQHLARSYLNLGPVLRATNRPQLAQERYNQAIALLTKLAQAYPDNPDYRHEVGVCFLNLGNLLADSNRQEADKAYAEARQRFQDLARDFPRVPIYRQKLANFYNSLGSLRARTGDLAGASAAWEEALALFDKLAAERPNVPAHQADLALVYGNLGWLLTTQKKWADARQQLQRAVACLKSALPPEGARNPAYLAALRNDYQALAETLLQLKEPAAAAEAAVSLSEVFRDRGLDYYYAACFLARCVPLANEETQRQVFTQKTIDLLRTAAQRGVDKDKRLPDIEEKSMKPLNPTVVRDLLAKLGGA